MSPCDDSLPKADVARMRRQPPTNRTTATSNPTARSLLMLVSLICGVGLGAAGLWIGERVVDRLKIPNDPGTNPNAQLRPADANGPLEAEEAEANGVFESVKDSVVNVDTVMLHRNEWLDDDAPQRQAGTGSGFIWDDDGRIVTNYHVIELVLKKPNELAIRVRLSGNARPFEARVIGVAPDCDLAVLQLAGKARDQLKPIGLSRSNDLRIGQKVYAIGNPFGLSHTLTQGIISALDRTIIAPSKAPIPGAIQHSAAINPGNSGGPLLNRFGKLIGVNTSIPETKGGGNVGIGFAIPSDTVNEVVTDIIRHGQPSIPDLGLTLYDQTSVRRAGYDRGVVIDQVEENGPAAEAGLRGVRRNTATGRDEPRDLILTIDGRPVNSPEDFQRIVAKLKPGQQIRMKILRKEKRHEQEIELMVTVRAV